MPIERELKFSLLDPPPAAEELAIAFSGSSYALRALGSRTHHDLYYDDDGALARAGLALRRRSSGAPTGAPRPGGGHPGGATETAALKTQGMVADALHEREEIEGPVEEGRWPSAILGELALRLGAGHAERLRPTIEFTTLRTSYAVHEGGRRVATLAFDEVAARYPSDERSAHFREAELEAEGDVPVATLQRIADRLEGVVALAPSGVTKLQRAEAVLVLAAGL
jgi:inorganic triphosphatase YgiF